MFIKHESFSILLSSSTLTCANEKLAAISVGSGVGHRKDARALYSMYIKTNENLTYLIMM